MARETLPLRFVDGSLLAIKPERYSKTCDELESFLEGMRHLHTKTFAKDVMFSHELKANNQIEGYNDDVKDIKEIIKRQSINTTEEQKKRIMNLYHGYNYILKGNNIDKDTLKKLYTLLSKGLLNENDMQRMGDYYRQDKVYILKGKRLDGTLDEGIDAENIEKFMDEYFDFLNNMDFSQSITLEYIKSQILHFYFVYIHPYFDVNGRTSRTLAMWYLLNQKAYPYIIFNRGIAFKGNGYDQAIMDVKKYHDISFFIEYMLETVQVELEKEYIMQNLAGNANCKLSGQDYQTLLYLLSMNGLTTVCDFSQMYNHFHTKVTCKNIYEQMIDPLITKGVLNVVRTTNSNMFGNYPNEVLEINPNLLDFNPDKINLLTKYKK